MKVSDINRDYQIDSDASLEAVLAKKFENTANAFWLWHEDAAYPMLGVFVKQELAYLHYIQAEGEAGFASVGGTCDLTRGQTTSFPISPHEADDIHILNEAVVPLSIALSAAKEFYFSKELPKCVEWLKL